MNIYFDNKNGYYVCVGGNVSGIGATPQDAEDEYTALVADIAIEKRKNKINWTKLRKNRNVKPLPDSLPALRSKLEDVNKLISNYNKLNYKAQCKNNSRKINLPFSRKKYNQLRNESRKIVEKIEVLQNEEGI